MSTHAVGQASSPDTFSPSSVVTEGAMNPVVTEAEGPPPLPTVEAVVPQEAPVVAPAVSEVIPVTEAITPPAETAPETVVPTPSQVEMVPQPEGGQPESPVSAVVSTPVSAPVQERVVRVSLESNAKSSPPKPTQVGSYSDFSELERLSISDQASVLETLLQAGSS